MSRMVSGAKTIVVGDQRYTKWEVRFEVLRRAIEYLEGRKYAGGPNERPRHVLAQLAE
jgi:hypothetical protein